MFIPEVQIDRLCQIQPKKTKCQTSCNCNGRNLQHSMIHKYITDEQAAKQDFKKEQQNLLNKQKNLCLELLA